MTWREWLRDLFREVDDPVLLDHLGVDAPPTVSATPPRSAAPRHGCGHVSDAYSTDPRTGQTACLPCFNAAKGYERGRR